MRVIMLLVLIQVGGRTGLSLITDCDPNTRFTCADGVCLSKAKECDGYRDCLEGEDEENCPEIPPGYCFPRNMTMARLNGYTCRKSCNSSSDCRARNKACICDDECGLSCINNEASCEQAPPTVANSSTFVTELRRGGPPIFGVPLVGSAVRYNCTEGMRLKGPLPRCTGRTEWSGERPQCVGSACDVAPVVPWATLNYTGSWPNRVARYSCHEGFYRRSGSLSLYCSKTGLWIGEPPVCETVQCGYPGPSIKATRGYIFSYGGLQFGDTIEFRCRRNYRLLGSRLRTCLGDGKWSGQLAVCDHRDDLLRCPHPGFPINGWMAYETGEELSINSTVRFGCDTNYILVGDEVQTCLWFKQWSGHATPLCIDPKYPSIASDVLDTLSRPSQNLQTRKITLGRSLLSHETDKEHDVYFMLDVSDSVLDRDLVDQMNFAKRFVRRMTRFEGLIRYGIMLFASKNLTALDIAEEPNPTPEDVIAKLDEILAKIGEKAYREETQGGTATAYALESLAERMGFMRDRRLLRNHKKTVKNHVLIFTDGKHTEGENPVKKRNEIEAEFAPNIEFYCITACKSCNTEAFEELYGLASFNEEGKKNYIFIEDFYQLSKYLDKVTDVQFDFEKCGQAGDVGSIKVQAKLGRVAGGEDAAENAWPWQVLITEREFPTLVLSESSLRGGGSVLSQKWILTAAHVFGVEHPSLVIPAKYIVAAGIFRLRSAGNGITSSVQMFQPESIIIHSDYEYTNYLNDIALVKVGPRLDSKTLRPDQRLDPMLTYTYYVRPVCLPCTGTCLKRHQLTRSDGSNLINETMLEDEKCLEEEKWLMDNSSKVVVTGFGHAGKTLRPDFVVRPTTKLQQGLVQIEEKQKCISGIRQINTNLEERGSEVEYVFSGSMFCSKPWSVDACKGDSGGPVVREVIDENSKPCWIQIGIVSFGYGCRTGEIPGYYTNVAKFIPWIRRITGNETVPNP